MKGKRLPHFQTDEEFAKFVAMYDMSSYLKDMELIDKTLTLAPGLAERIRERTKKRLIALRLPQWQINGARQIAKKKRVPYQALIRNWIGEGLSREIRRTAHPI